MVPRLLDRLCISAWPGPLTHIPAWRGAPDVRLLGEACGFGANWRLGRRLAFRSKRSERKGRQSRAVGPPGHHADPGPTAQPLLRPILNSRSFRSKPPTPASGASVRQCILTSGSSLVRAACSGGSIARLARTARLDSGDRFGLETVACSERLSCFKRLGLDVIIADIEHLPAQRGKNLGGASGTTRGRQPANLGSQTTSRDPLSIATHRAPDQLDRAQSAHLSHPRGSGRVSPGKPAEERCDVFALNYQFTLGKPSRPVTDGRFEVSQFPAINTEHTTCRAIERRMHACNLSSVGPD